MPTTHKLMNMVSYTKVFIYIIAIIITHCFMKLQAELNIDSWLFQVYTKRIVFFQKFSEIQKSSLWEYLLKSVVFFFFAWSSKANLIIFSVAVSVFNLASAYQKFVKLLLGTTPSRISSETFVNLKLDQKITRFLLI